MKQRIQDPREDQNLDVSLFIFSSHPQRNHGFPGQNRTFMDLFLVAPNTTARFMAGFKKCSLAIRSHR